MVSEDRGTEPVLDLIDEILDYLSILSVKFEELREVICGKRNEVGLQNLQRGDESKTTEKGQNRHSLF